MVTTLEQIEKRALEIKQQRIAKRAEEIACKFVLAECNQTELGRGMSFLK